MLQLYDLNKVKIKGLKLYKDFKVESVLSSGDKVLSFLYPARLSKDIKEECYIRTKTDEVVVKEISDQGEWKSIKATINVEDLEGQPWEHFDTTEQTIEQCLTLACAGTGWTVQVNGVTKKRTIRKTNCSSWDIIQEAKKIYRVEISFDTINKIVKVAEKLGSDKGVYFMDSLNLRNLDIQSNSYDFYTRLIAIGKDDLKVTVENFQYSSKSKTLIWKDERYTDINSLTEDATAKLEEISKPYRSYGADIIDLANLSDKYNILAYSLGDTITLVSKEKGIKEKQRIVKITEYPEEPNRNTCEIANTILTFEDIQKEQQDTTDTVNNITSDNGTISEGAIQTAVEHLTINKVDVNSLNAVEIRVGTLEATTATITQLNAVNATISNLQVDKANVTDLTASTGRITVLESSVADIGTLVNGNLTSANIQSLILTSDKVTVANGFIKDAMIDTLSVSKILAGDISTTKFRIVSNSGNMLISDNTIQISDASRVRVQIGKDASNDYNMYVWDSTGKIMFDATGLKENGIKTKIIRDDMVSDTANINGSKLNIATVVTSINGGTTTLNSSKVLLDGTTQTLNVAFNTLTAKVDSAPPTIITDSSITKLTGAIDGTLRVNSIKGRTLQNLWSNYETIHGLPEDTYWYASNTYPIVDLGGKTLTLINVTSRAIRYNKYSMDDVFIINYDVPPYSIKVVTLENYAKIRSLVVLASSGWTYANKTELKGMILEGDYTNKFIPQYFDGIRSVAETGENLEVVSCGKNLFDKSSLGTTNGALDELGNMMSVDGYYTTDFIPVKYNTNYFIPNSNTARSKMYDKNKKVLNVTNYNDLNRNTSGSIIFANVNPSCAYIRVSYGNITLKDTLQLEEGTTSTTYEPYQESRQPIPLAEPLRGLPNGVTDTVDFARGVVVKNVGNRSYTTGDETNVNFITDKVTTYYQLATPIETPIEVTQYMKQFKDGNLIVDGSLINPTIDFTYSTSLASATSMAREVIESNTTAINVQQGEISTLISNTTIIKDGITTQLKDAYNSTVATVDGISTIVGNHTTSISNLNQFVTDNGSKIAQAYDGITQKVWSTDIATVEGKFANYSTTTQMESAITQSATGIKSEVSNTYLSKGDATIQYATKSLVTQTADQVKLDFTSSGGYNLLKNGNLKDGASYWGAQASGLVGSDLTRYFDIRNDAWTGYVNALEVRIGNMSSGEFGLVQGFSTIIGKKYVFTCYLAGHRSNKRVIVRGNASSEGNWIGAKDYGAIDGGDNLANWVKVVVPFVAERIWTTVEIDIISTIGSDGYVWAKELMVSEGSEWKPFSPYPNEIYDGNTQIDARGVTIFNGALTLKNNAGVNMLSADTNGNLVMKGKLVAGGSNRIEVDNGYINFINGESLTHSLAYNRYVPAMYFGNSISASAQSNGSAEYDTSSRRGLNAFGKVATFMLDLYAPATPAGAQAAFDDIDIRSLVGEGTVDFGAVSAAFANCFASEYIAQVSLWRGNVYGTSTLETISLRLRSVQGTSTGMTVRVCIAIFGYR